MASQLRAAATRQKLVDAAVRLFAENGYLKTTPKHIADGAGLTTGAFYYHFKSKDALAAEVIDQSWPKSEQTLARYTDQNGSGIERLIHAEFAAVGFANRDLLQRIGLDLRMAIGHLGAPARQAYQDRVEAFSLLVAAAFRESELRDGVTRKQASELLWIASNGAQMMSDALVETGPALFGRLGMAWKTALRTIVPDEMFTRLGQFIDAAVAQYGQAETAGRVA